MHGAFSFAAVGTHQLGRILFRHQQSGLFQHMSEQDYEDVMNTHVRGLFYVLKAVAPCLLKQKQGRVVCLSSIWGSTGGAGEVLYSAAKGAVNGFVKALAKESAPFGHYG